MDLFWILIIVGAAVVGLGWIGYGIWVWRERKLEKTMPKERSERFVQTQSAVTDYAKKLAEYQKPIYKRADSTPSTSSGRAISPKEDSSSTGAQKPPG